MDILREESPATSQHAASISSLDRALLLLTVVSPFVLFFYHPGHEWIGVIPLFVVLLHFWRKDFGLFVKAVFWPMLYLALLYVPWPSCFVLPLALYFSAYVGSRKFRLIDRWLTAGRLTWETVIWMLATIVVSSGALLTWVVFFHPQLDDLAGMIPAVRPWQLVAIGIAFSTLNATWEEFILKGLAWSSLQSVFQSAYTVNVAQAVLFGLAHFQGFPRGWGGVLMAALYGLALGVIRKKSGGLLASIVTHIFADGTIFVMLYLISIGLLPAVQSGI
jgi:membrane protease YdiL (CAAX protease family)